MFDTYSGGYDYSACQTTNNGNCKIMDCHDTSSDTWELLGVFKEASYFGNDAFFEQLFKHEGVCLWNNDDTYEFMSETRENSFSSGCLETGIADVYSRSLYIDLKPTFNGNMTYSLYTDQVCSQEYEGYDYNVESVAANMGLLYGEYMEQWNEAMEVFKVCQPCRAYNLQNSYSSSKNYGYSNNNNGNNNNGNNNNDNNNKNNDEDGDGGNDDGSSSSSGYWQYTGNRDLEANEEGNEEERKLYQYKFSNYNNNDDGSSSSSSYNYNTYNNYNGGQASNGWYTDDAYDPNNGNFRCDDDADYSNVNQCMKFRTHADLEAASWDDLVAATNQGGILTVNVGGTIFGSPFVSKEQEEYLTYVRREKQAAYEKELEQKVAQAMKEAPSAKSAVFIGQLWVAFGVVAFVFTGNRLAKQLLSRRTIKSKSLAEPLNKDAVLA